MEYNNNYVSPSVYVRFAFNNLPSAVQLNTNQKLYALIWTTTPWTLPSNQAICFNSSLEYSIVELKEKSSKDLYLIASNLIEEFIKTTNIQCDVKQTLTGLESSQLYLYRNVILF